MRFTSIGSGSHANLKPVIQDQSSALVEPELLCPECDYSLRGLSSTTCPECGCDLDESFEMMGRLIRFERIKTYLLLVVVLLLGGFLQLIGIGFIGICSYGTLLPLHLFFGPLAIDVGFAILCGFMLYPAYVLFIAFSKRPRRFVVLLLIAHYLCVVLGMIFEERSTGDSFSHEWRVTTSYLRNSQVADTAFIVFALLNILLLWFAFTKSARFEPLPKRTAIDTNASCS